ncbi:hypothetical protein AAFF_G00354750 [Aldrovandia affinis]|uniref:TERF1-interacting nuclear factor 2 N-terminal domain-containing protein n=1 Tax=Aldrovandia affinis TaxID=143900 RepID=A0AAD7WNJ4_9TELE|nr:hypothetical protein AAFF_G00354750 [Aldrovandia affinis]
METRSSPEREIMDPSLPLSSLRLLAPPLRLVSAAMWQVVQKQDIMHYGKLEELVSLVTEAVPELLSYRQRTQLILALRTKRTHFPWVESHSPPLTGIEPKQWATCTWNRK